MAKKSLSFYWIKCWDRMQWTRRGRRRRYYYSVMHSNGEILSTSQGIDNRSDRDAVARGLLSDGIHMVSWVDSQGREETRDFAVS